MSAQMHGKCKTVTYKLFSNEINYLKALSCHNVSYCRHLIRHLLIYILSFFLDIICCYSFSLDLSFKLLYNLHIFRFVWLPLLKFLVIASSPSSCLASQPLLPPLLECNVYKNRDLDIFVHLWMVNSWYVVCNTYFLNEWMTIRLVLFSSRFLTMLQSKWDIV